MTLSTSDEVVLDHGTGAKLSQELIGLIVATLGEVYLGEMEDSATIELNVGRIAITTDSFVVDPPYFGNGDIGKIAVCGTVNDLAVVGATPKYLTLGMILETGLPIRLLVQALESIRATALEAGVHIVCGDTKVVGKGEADRIFLNTAGIGVYEREPLRMRNVSVGDRVILSGPIGNHAVHLLSIREGLGFETRVVSDCAPLNGMIAELLDAVPAGAIRSIRDVTRGGLSAVLHEYSGAVGQPIRILDADLPIQHETRMACDMLGVDPIHLANEGCLCLFVAPEAESAVLESLRAHRYGQHAVSIGAVVEGDGPAVLLERADGGTVQLEELLGAELPRLC